MGCVRKVLRIIFAGSFAGSLFLLSFHVHAEHTSDLHKHHASCAVCAHSPKFNQKAVSQASASIASDFLIREILFDASEASSSHQSAYSRRSRAPPF